MNPVNSVSQILMDGSIGNFDLSNSAEGSSTFINSIIETGTLSSFKTATSVSYAGSQKTQ